MRDYFVAAAGALGFAFGYALPVFAKLPNLYYDPIARRWWMTQSAGAIPLGYYGLILYGIVGGIVSALIARVVARNARGSDRSFGLWAAWALTGLSLVACYFVWNNWP